MTSERQNFSEIDPQSLVALMPPVARLARILAPTPEQAEDLAQDALVQVWAQLRRGGDIDDLRPYLMTVLRNANRATRPADQELTENNSPVCGPQFWGRIACENVSNAITSLSRQQRDLLLPLITEGATYKQLAQRFDLPIGTVMSRLARARARLRRELNLPADHAVEALLDTT